MKTTRLLLTALLLTLLGESAASAKEAYCTLTKTEAIDGTLQSVTARFFFDNLRSQRENECEVVDVPDRCGRVAIPFADYVHVIFDNSFADYRPHSTCYWFFWLQARVEVSFSGWENLNTSEVTSMSSMFYSLGRYEDGDKVKTCKVKNLDLSHFDTSREVDMSFMFYNSYLDEVDLSSFTFTSSTNTYLMMGSSILKKLTIPASANYLSDEAFTYMGSVDDVCTLVYPDGFTLEGAKQDSNFFIWKGGFFKDVEKMPMGDVNHDGAVSVADVMLTVDYVLGHAPAIFFAENADTNGDGNITVADVISIVGIVVASR